MGHAASRVRRVLRAMPTAHSLTRSPVQEVQQLVQQEIQVCDTIEAISGHLSILKDKISLPVGPSPDYSVEALVL